MAVVKTETGVTDAMSDGRELEVQHLVETAGLSPNQARDLLTKFGGDWGRIRAEAEGMRSRAEQ